MDDIIFMTGDFVAWKGKTYRSASYPNEYALFLPEDIDKKEQLQRINKDQADIYYTQLVQCDISHVRYGAVAVQNGMLLYHRCCGDKNCDSVPLEECNEIWIQRNFPGKHIEIETIWHSPNCPTYPGSEKFYAERMANGNIMVSYLSELMNLKHTISAIQALYGERINFKESSCGFLTDSIYQPFTVDGIDFMLSLDEWDIVCVSPEQREGSPYIHEIVDYLNSNTPCK